MSTSSTPPTTLSIAADDIEISPLSWIHVERQNESYSLCGLDAPSADTKVMFFRTLAAAWLEMVIAEQNMCLESDPAGRRIKLYDSLVTDIMKALELTEKIQGIQQRVVVPGS